MLLSRAYQRLREDWGVAFSRDPAARSRLEVLLCYPGLHAVFLHRVAHWMWRHRMMLGARFLAHVSRGATGIEIHPGAVIGKRFFIDHGAGVVIGETSDIGDDCVLYQGVTLGGVSLHKGKRHPTLGDGVVIGAGAKILGPLAIGDGAMVGAGSVVVTDVPAGGVAVGVPAKLIARRNAEECGKALRHDCISDPLATVIQQLEARVAALETALESLGPRPAPEAPPRFP